MKTPGRSALRKLIYVLDAAAVILAFSAAFALQPALREVWPSINSLPLLHLYVLVAAIALPIWVVLVPVFRLNLVFEKIWPFREIALQLLKHHLTGFVSLSVLIYITQVVFNRSLVLLFMACSFTLMFFIRFLFGLRQRYGWEHGDLRPRIILVGDPTDSMNRLLRDMAATEMPPEIIGRVTSSAGASPGAEPLLADIPCIGAIGDLDRLLHDMHADEVLFYPPFHTPEAAASGLKACETVGVQARLVIDLSHPGQAAPRVVNVAGHPFITFDTLPPYPELRAIKHGFDALAAGLGLLALFPLLLPVCLAIYLTMGRPIWFFQQRAGKNGRIFRMIKFRTMIVDAERQQTALEAKNEMAGPVFKVTNDPRVTQLGKFLRRTSIDELPQLINVLRGTMSLVGPRPLPIREQQAIYGWHRRRLSMKPGITGLWQVSGRSNIDFEQWMKLDLRYVDEWSLRLDLKILLRTIPAVILRKGAK